MLSRVRRSILPTLTVLALFGFVFSTSLTYFEQRLSPPVEFHKSEFVELTAKPGDKLHLTIERTIHRPCPAALVLPVWHREGTTEFVGLPMRPIYGDMREYVGTGTLNITTFAPDVKPGRWCYQPKIVYQECPARNYTVTQTAACIDVVAP